MDFNQQSTNFFMKPFSKARGLLKTDSSYYFNQSTSFLTVLTLTPNINSYRCCGTNWKPNDAKM